jgi:hypothetical protein
MSQIRRLASILRNGLTWLLAVLALALAVQSVRAYWKMDIISHFYRSTASDGTPRYHRLSFISMNGCFSLGSESEPQPGLLAKDAFATGRSWEVPALNVSTNRNTIDPPDRNFMGFTYLGPDEFGRGIDGKRRIWRVAVPWAFLACAAGFFPLLILYKRLRRAHSTRAGHCPECGYDLRATPERCPECGRQQTVVTAAYPCTGEAGRFGRR